MTDDVKPIETRPEPTGWTPSWFPANGGGQIALNLDGDSVRVGAPYRDIEPVYRWLENGGLRDLVAAVASKSGDGIEAKLAAIGEKVKWPAGLMIRTHDIPPGKPWSVFAGGYFSLSHATADEAIDEALRHFGLASGEPPPAPAPEAGLTAEDITILRRFTEWVAKLGSEGESLVSMPYERIKLLDAMLDEREAAMTTEAKLEAIRRALDVESIKVEECSPGCWWVAARRGPLHIHYGPVAGSHDGAIEAAFQLYCPTQP